MTNVATPSVVNCATKTLLSSPAMASVFEPGTTNQEAPKKVSTVNPLPELNPSK